MARTPGAKDKMARRRKRSKVKELTIAQIKKMGVGTTKRRVGRPAKPKSVAEILVVTGYKPTPVYMQKPAKKRGRPKKS